MAMYKYISTGAFFYTLLCGFWLAYAHKYNIDGMAGLGGDDESWFWTRLLFPIFCPIAGGIMGAVTYGVVHFANGQKRYIAVTMSLITLLVIFGPVIQDYVQRHKSLQYDFRTWPLYLSELIWVLILLLYAIKGNNSISLSIKVNQPSKRLFWAVVIIFVALINVNFIIDVCLFTKASIKHAQWAAKWETSSPSPPPATTSSRP